MNVGSEFLVFGLIAVGIMVLFALKAWIFSNIKVYKQNSDGLCTSCFYCIIKTCA